MDSVENAKKFLMEQLKSGPKPSFKIQAAMETARHGLATVPAETVPAGTVPAGTVPERGSISATEQSRRADAHGLSARTLARARKELGIVTYRIGPQWWMALPHHAPPRQVKPKIPAF